jgi:hypothetical protein
MTLACELEEIRPMPGDVRGELDGAPYRQLGEDLLQDRLSLDERQRAQVSAVEVKDVEQDIGRLARAAMASEGFLQRPEVRDALRGQHCDLAVEAARDRVRLLIVVEPNRLCGGGNRESKPSVEGFGLDAKISWLPLSASLMLLRGSLCLRPGRKARS